MDETGITPTTNKTPKVFSISGKKQVGVISSAERGKLTTVICCCNAAGSFIPPFFIFAREKMQPRLMDDALLVQRGIALQVVGQMVSCFWSGFIF